jgi:hypothetical protein
MEVYEALKHNEEDRKELESVLHYLLPLWYCGLNDAQDQLNMMINFNRQINIDWVLLNEHPELRTKILAAIGLGHVARHDFHYRKQKKSISPLKSFLEQKYPDIKDDEIELWCHMNSETSLIDLCSIYGIQEKERTEIINCYRDILL